MPEGYGRNRSSIRLSIPEVVVKIRPRRPIEGISAVLLPFHKDGSIDYDSFAENLLRTVDVGLTPAINVEFGLVDRLTQSERADVLDLVRDVMVARPFVAGAYVDDAAGDTKEAYLRAVAEVVAEGGTPVVMPSGGLSALDESSYIRLHLAMAEHCPALIAFEADPQVVPFGKIQLESAIQELMSIPQVVGLRHSSMSRRLEWERLSLRDEVRPDFRIYSGNDIALDMVMYGSDYFLSVSACAPEAFALRDEHWKKGDARFYELNDLLQSLGMLMFRPPILAAHHSATQMLKLRGRIGSDAPARSISTRPTSDIEILTKIIARLDQLLHAGHVHL
jgi:dihydrodipicolinate synthase/N-acetylneuraminate lyase